MPHLSHQPPAKPAIFLTLTINATSANGLEVNGAAIAT